MGKTHKFDDKISEMKEVEKFKKKVMGTFLKLYILHLINTEPQYGYILRDIITDKFGIQPSKASCYTKLYSLERGGFITDKEAELLFPPCPLPHRRYYTITKKGKELLKVMLTYLDDVSIPEIEECEDTCTTSRKRFIHPTS